MMCTLLAVAPVAAGRRVAEIKAHLQRHDQVLHGSDHDANFGALDKRVVSQVPVHDSFERGNVLANEK